ADAVIMAATHTTGQPAVLSAELVRAIKPGAFVVNVARGAAVDNEACLAALDRGNLSGLGLDVFPTEPYPADGPLATHPRVMATAHTGALTTSYFAAGATRLGAAITNVLAGRAPAHSLDGRRS
ncbi:MAG: hydroxyacid dehydrogenase, partial [Glaciihabitans sp.]|nr:hydroxyacid dehydrogenase [Glaciihabitans sp.]